MVHHSHHRSTQTVVVRVPYYVTPSYQTKSTSMTAALFESSVTTSYLVLAAVVGAAGVVGYLVGKNR